jgi:hypothetical protein
MQRRLEDIEKRLTRVERMLEKPEVDVRGQAVYMQTLARVARKDNQYCLCGRDVCRAPDCPSHRENNCGNDPLGR